MANTSKNVEKKRSTTLSKIVEEKMFARFPKNVNGIIINRNNKKKSKLGT
jgi:hypothetical protein